MKETVTFLAANKALFVVTLALLSNLTQPSHAGLFDDLKKGLEDVEQAITDGNELLQGAGEAPAEKDKSSNQSQAPIDSSPVAEQPSSQQTAAVAAANQKTSIYVTAPNLNMFNTVIEASVRARMDTTQGLARFALQNNKAVRYDPVEYTCRLLHWRETTNPTEISDRSANGEFTGLSSANIEFTGVLPTGDPGVCAFDEAIIVGTYKQAVVSTPPPAESSQNYGSRHFDSMTVSVFEFRESTLQTCTDQYGAENAKSACRITTHQQTLPSIIFQIPIEEINRLRLRTANRKTGYWKAGFTPTNVESLTGGKKVKLTNINMHHDRGELYFESLTILE